MLIVVQPVIVRDVLSRLLGQEPDLSVVGHASDEAEILELLKKAPVDLLVFDYEALGPSSESIITRLRRSAPTTRVLVLSTRSDEEHVERVLRAGGAGLVGKQDDFETLLRAIRAIASGEVWANRRATALTLEHLTSFSLASARNDQLTRREHEIVDAVVHGLRNKEIAHQLNISEKTVKSHLNNIFQKLGLEGRFALAFFEKGQTSEKP